jgi:hypothetical protein
MHNTEAELERNISSFLAHIQHATANKEDLFSKKKSKCVDAIAQASP